MSARDRAAAIGRFEEGPDLKAAAKRVADRYIAPDGLAPKGKRTMATRRAAGRLERLEKINALEALAFGGLAWPRPSKDIMTAASDAIQALARLARTE